MSVGVREGSPDPSDEGSFSNTLETLDQAQADFFEALEDWTRLPIGPRLSAVTTASNHAGQAFHDTVTAIIKNDETEFADRATQIATLFNGVEETRVTFLRAQLPAGDFSPNPIEPEAFAQNLEAMYAECSGGQGDDETSLLELLSADVAGQHMGFMIIDLQEFIETVQDSRWAKTVLDSRPGCGQESWDIGKISAAVVIGSLAARGISKRLDSRG